MSVDTSVAGPAIRIAFDRGTPAREARPIRRANALRSAPGFLVLFAAMLMVAWPEFANIGFADIWKNVFATVGLHSLATDASAHVAEFALMAWASLKLAARFPMLSLAAGLTLLFLRHGL